MTKADRIRQLIAEGWTCQAAIAREVGCSETFVWQTFNPEKKKHIARQNYATSAKCRANTRRRVLRQRYAKYGWTEADIEARLKAEGYA